MESSAKRSICSLKKLNRLGKSIVALFLCIALVLGYSYRCPVQVHATAGFWETAYDVLVAQILNSMGVKLSGDVSDEQYNTVVGAIRRRAEDSLKAVNQQGLFQSIYNGWTSDWFSVGQDAYNAVANAWNTYQKEVNFRYAFGWTGNHDGAFSSSQEMLSYYGMSSGCAWASNEDNCFLKNFTGWKPVSGVECSPADFTKNTSSSEYTLRKIICGDDKDNISLILFNQDSNDAIFLRDQDTFSKNLWLQGTQATSVNLVGGYTMMRYGFQNWFKINQGEFIKTLKATNSDGHDYYFFCLRETCSNGNQYWNYYYVDGTKSGIVMSDSGGTFEQTEVVDKKDVRAEGESVVAGVDPQTIWEHIRERQLKGGVTTQDKNEIKIKSAAGVKNPADVRAQTQAQTTGLEATAEDTAADEAANAGKSTIPASASNLPNFQLPTGLQKKFPFCLPWDLVACYKLFQVPAKAPVWSIPVSIDQGLIHVHQTYTYDMNSNGIMDNVLPVFKWFLNIAVVLGLIAITKKIMS